MDFNTILDSICGPVEEGSEIGKASSTLSIMRIKGEEVSQSEDYCACTAIYQIEVHGEFIQLDICFGNDTEFEGPQYWHILQKYGKELSEAYLSNESKDDAMPTLGVTLVPHDYEGKVFLTLFNPIFWTIQPSKLHDDKNNTIRLLFPIDNAKLDYDESISVDDINLEEQRALEEEARVTELYMRQKEEESRRWTMDK